jgi:hypothetical protein
MTTEEYIERSAELACQSSIAAVVSANPDFNDADFLLLKPRRIPEREAESAARWPGRELRPVGMVALCGTSPRFVFKAPLTPEQVSALAGEFLSFLHTLFLDGLTAQQNDELRRMLSLPDTRDSRNAGRC